MSPSGLNPSSFGPASLTRRHFLRRLGLTTAAAATGMQTWHRLQGASNPTQPLKVVIVGAGLSGLVAAYEMEQRGHEVVMLEARTSHVGGRARTVQLGGGLHGELGAMRIPEKHDLTRRYIKEFGLTLRKFVQSNPEAFYYTREHRTRIKDELLVNQYYQLRPDEQSKTVYDNWLGAIVSILDGMTADEKADLRRARFQTAKVRELDRLSLEQALKNAGMSQEAIEILAVLWANETSLTTALTVILREELEGTWNYSFDELAGGTEQLPLAFLSRLKSKPRMGAEVFRVEQDWQRGKATAFYRLNGVNEQVEGDLLLCTVPLGVMTRIEFNPPLSGTKNRAMRQVTYDSSTKVLAVNDRRFWETEEGIYGGGTYTDLPTGITYYPSDNADAKDPQVSNRPAAMLASYTWGEPARRLGVLPHAERSQFALDTLAKVHPQLRQPGRILQTASWCWDNDPWSAGAFCWFSPGQHETLYEHLLAPEGRLFFAGEHASLTPTWMQGALESGLRAVEQMLASPLTLSVNRATAGKVILRWPRAAEGFRLEASPNPAGGNWTPVAVEPASVGEDLSVTLEAAGPGKLFRLAKP